MPYLPALLPPGNQCDQTSGSLTFSTEGQAANVPSRAPLAEDTVLRRGDSGAGGQAAMKPEGDEAWLVL